MERGIKTSAFVIRDPSLNDYVRGVFCRTVGTDACAPIRIYLLRTPAFNAGMYPTGMMVINSGLLLRMRDEAQLAAILGHEFTHYTHRHQIQSFRDAKAKANAATWLSFLPVGGLAAAAAASVAQLGLAASIFSFSREMEAEADATSVPLMAKAGYDAGQAWRVWEQLRAEQDATAAARNTKSRKDKHGGIFGSHPPTAERLATLRTLAANHPGGIDGRAAYVAALRPWWPQLVDDQVKLNDFGGTEFVLGKLAEGGWTADLLYARGELYRTRGLPADLTAAAGYYRAAIAQSDAPAEAWRGLGLVALRSGERAEARTALETYLRMRPDAADRSMIEMMTGEIS